MEIFPLSDWLKPRLGKKYNAIATSGDVIARLVSRQILLVADNVIDVSLWLMRHMGSSNTSFTKFM